MFLKSLLPIGVAATVLVSTLAGPVYADDCPPTFAANPPASILSGGLFYLSSTGAWLELRSGKVAFAGRRLEVVFVPRVDLCASDDAADTGKRSDCGDKGFALVKTVKDTGAASDHSVKLTRGKKYAQETHFHDFDVDLDQYQAFHKSDRVAGSSIRTDWHDTYVNNGVQHSTFEPEGKRLQFAFPDTSHRNDVSGWRLARLLRFETPEPGTSICVPFDVTWNSPDMKLVLDFMLVDPVLDDFGFDPVHFKLERDNG